MPAERVVRRRGNLGGDRRAQRLQQSGYFARFEGSCVHAHVNAQRRIMARMPNTTRPSGIWKDEPDEHDFPAAMDYLTLVAAQTKAETLVEALRTTETVHRKAKDLLRASRLDLLPVDNPHVRSDLRKIKRGQPLSPVLLVRGNAFDDDRPLQVADGYHRVCASYHTDENLEIPCRIADA